MLPVTDWQSSKTVGSKQHLVKVSKMRHFTVNLVVNIIGAILFLVMGIALIVGFVLNQSIVEELQQVKIIVLLLLVFLMILLVMMMQAANFDNWQPFILISGILALFTAAVFILGSWKVINMMAMMKLMMVMVMVKVMTILIHVQEATFASGGKNKAVRKSVPRKSKILILKF